MAYWIFGALGAIAGLTGLFMSARADDVGIQVFGSALMVFGVAFCFWMLRATCDETEGKDRPVEGA
jgi:hypothetical protein